MSTTTPKFEPFSGGLVTSRDASTLNEGELQQAAEAIYRPNDIAVYKVRGRTKYDATALASAIKGLRLLEYDDSSNKLIAYAGSMYYRAAMTNAESVGAGTFLGDPILSTYTVANCTVVTGTDAYLITTTTVNGFRGIYPGYGISGHANIPAGTVVLNVSYDATYGWSIARVSQACTGDFSTTTLTITPTVGSGTTMDAVQYNNINVLLNGIQNWVIPSPSDTGGVSATTPRRHGLLAISTAAAVAQVTPGYVWDNSLGAGYWFFITAEVVNPGAFEVESTNTVQRDDVKYFQQTASTMTSSAIRVTRPDLVNPQATHWRVYGAVNKDAPSCPPISLFQLMSDTTDISVTSVVIGNVTLYNSANAAYAGAVDSTSSAAHWVGEGNILGAPNSKYGTTVISGAWIKLDTFTNLGSYSGTFSGIKVLVKMWVPYTVAREVDVTCAILYGAGGTVSAERTKRIDIKNQNPTVTFGDNNDGWGRLQSAWVAGDITPAGFGVYIAINKVGSSMPGWGVWIDSVEVQVYTKSSSSTIPTFGRYFPATVVSIGGVASVIGSNGPPPVATTGDIFDSQLVLNDLGDRSLIKFSLPDAIEYFPPVYFINFESKHTDIVTNIGRLGNILIVGMQNAVYRVNYLPRDSDSEFDRGRCYEPASENQGIVGTHAATNFTIPSIGIMRAFVSYAGLHVTDGFRVETWSDDIDWPALVSTPATASGVDYIQNCIVVDYPVLYQLWLYYTPVGGTTNTKALVFHYHPTQVKENGKPKITGPISVQGGAATLGKVSGMPVLLTGGHTSAGLGWVFVEDRGYVDNSVTAAPNVEGFAIRTREMYLNGLGRTATLNTLFVRHRADTTSTVTVTPSSRSGANAQVGGTAKTFATTNGGAYELPFSDTFESIDFKLSEEATAGAQQIRLIGLSMELVEEGLVERRTT